MTLNSVINDRGHRYLYHFRKFLLDCDASGVIVYTRLNDAPVDRMEVGRG